MRFHLSLGSNLSQLDIALVDTNRYSRAMLRVVLEAFEVKRVREFENPSECFHELVNDPSNFVIAGWFKGRHTTEDFIRNLRNPAADPMCFAPVLISAESLAPVHKTQILRLGANKVQTGKLIPSEFYDTLHAVLKDRRRIFIKDGQCQLEVPEHLQSRRGMFEKAIA